MNKTSPKIGVNDIVRFALEIVALVSLVIWGFGSFDLPWPGVAIGIAAPVLAALLWALFLSPKAVLSVDTFIKALVEIAIFTAVALAWWSMGQPIVAVLIALVAAVSGIINGRKELS